MLSSLQIGGIALETPLLLAPLAGYTDGAFRIGIRKLGGIGLAFTEMLNPRSVMYGGGRRRTALLAREAGDCPLGWQIYGSDPVLLADCAQYLLETRQAELIDINMGCPQRKIAGRGEGAALLKNPVLARRIAAAVAAAVPVPVTVKMRIGWDDGSRVAPMLAAEFASAGVSAVTVHGRTGRQKYSGRSDDAAIREVVQAAGGLPIIGNGDLVTPADVRRLLETTGCAGVMIGRAALSNPWIFAQIMEFTGAGAGSLEISRRRRIDFLLAHLDRLGKLYGWDRAVKMFRKWIPQHAVALGITKPDMVIMLQIREIDRLRAALRQGVINGKSSAPPTASGW